MTSTATTTQCMDCLSSDLGVVFGHDCPNDPRYGSTTLALARTHRGDSVDAPERGDGSGRSHRQATPATDAQVRYLVKLGMPEAEARKLDKRAASKAIDTLAKAPRADAPQPARTNRYAATCTRCGGQVAAEAGVLAKTASGWQVTHTTCPAAPAPQAQAPQPDVPAGHYAIASTGSNDLAFYRVDRPSKGAYAGRVFVKLVVGGHPDMNVRRDHVAGILARIAADPQAAARYGQELGRCCACNRHLTDETSRALGIGPECRKAA